MANWVTAYLAANPDLAALPIAKRARHSLHFLKPNGRVEAHIVGAPCHYENGPGNWEPIDTALVNRGTYYSATGVPIRITDGEVSIENGTYKQKPARIVRLRPSNGAITQIANIPSGGTVSGDTVTQDGGSWSHTIRLLEGGVKESLILNTQPSFPGGTQSTDYICIETVVTGKTWTDGWVDTEYEADGYFFPLPTARDANGNIPVTRRYAKSVSGIQYLYTGVTTGWLETAAYPVEIDPDFLDTTADGLLNGFNTDYPTARSTYAAFGIADQSQYIGQLYVNPNYWVYRIFYRFDTQTIDSDAIVTSVVMKLTPTSVDTGTNFDVQIVKQTWTSLLSDQEATYDACLSGTLDDNIWRNTSGMVVNTQYSSGALNTGWIVKEGYTSYSLRSSRDKDGNAPTAGERFYLAMQNHTTESYRPILTVEYSEGGATPITKTLGDTMSKYRTLLP